MTYQRSRPPEASRHEAFWAVWTVAAAFGCYFCMYGFRRPFTAATFSDPGLVPGDFKSVLVLSQVAGYLLSKLVGIKLIAEMPRQRRAVSILGLIAAAELALVGFALVPRPWNAVCLFFNGLPLGLVFGLVLGFLEGRRTTEALAAGLCASFIVADGVTKSIGAWLLTRGVTEDWMPCLAGLLFVVPLVVCVGMLARIPAPNDRDVAARTERFVMTRAERWGFLRRQAACFLPLVLMYLVVTIVRSLRADFAPELWESLGSPAAPSTFTRSELWVALGVLLVNGSASWVGDNRRAFLVSLATCGAGFLLLAGALVGLQAGRLSGFGFMVLSGLGLYLPYVAVHTTVFERLLAMTRERGNLGYLMYVADAAGYLGYVLVIAARHVAPAADDVLNLFLGVACLAVGTSLACLVLSGYYSLVRRTEVACPAASESAA